MFWMCPNVGFISAQMGTQLKLLERKAEIQLIFLYYILDQMGVRNLDNRPWQDICHPKNFPRRNDLDGYCHCRCFGG